MLNQNYNIYYFFVLDYKNIRKTVSFNQHLRDFLSCYNKRNKQKCIENVSFKIFFYIFSYILCIYGKIEFASCYSF